MAHAATLNDVERYENQLTPGWGKLMMWVFLCSDAMSFAGLLAAYGAVRLGSSDWPVPATHLGVPLTALNTFILICSSVTMIQAYEWTHLIMEGMTIQANPWGVNTLFGATFYILTGFHGCHVLSGVVYLFCIFVRALQGAYSAENNSSVEIVGLYWHFVDLIWILVFTFVYLIA